MHPFLIRYFHLFRKELRYKESLNNFGCNLVPWVYSPFKMAAERRPWHTPLWPPAKYSTNRGVFCHVTHNRISFSLHLISGSRNQKWLTMSEDLASIWIHFACFSSKIVFFVDRWISKYIYRDFYYLDACDLSI